MRKIILFTILLIFIPFFILQIFNFNKNKEIELKYITNTTVRVKRLDTNNIEIIPIEKYIEGVLAGEMPISFDLEALKSQAVASRSYVLKRIEYNIDNDYDVVDSILNQVYLDEAYLKEVWKEDYVNNINKIRKAVNDTIGEYLEYDGSVIDALFFSTSNGYTEDVDLVFDLDLPYLKSVESIWDENVSSAFNATTTYELEDFYNKLGLKYNDKLEIEILKRSNTNRILKLKINNYELTGRNVYEKLGLKSTDFEIIQENKKVIINTKGYGHGVGMSQYGAQGMALEGYSYKDILKYYYKDVEIKKK